MGILSGAVISVIKPAVLQAKSRQAVLRANMEKACLALESCAAANSDATSCDTADKVGVSLTDGQPLGSVYCPVDKDGNPVNSTCDATTVAPVAIATLGTTSNPAGSATLECRYACVRSFGAISSSSALHTPTGYSCLIPALVQ